MMTKDDILKNFEEAYQLLYAFYNQEKNMKSIEQAGIAMVHALNAGNKIISCGNGGSMADAMHFAEELTGRFRDTRPALAAIAISDPTHISCVANDYGYDYIFSKYIEGLGKAGDVLLAISTSGNSPNVVKAAESARAKGILVVGLTGKDGGKLAPLCDVEIRVPHLAYADRVQEIHIKVIHNLIQFTEANVTYSSI
jgi:D-sedoheptulose 7-phosphate isomerase